MAEQSVSKKAEEQGPAPAPAPFQRSQRSIAWDHYERSTKSATCKLCRKSFAYHGGTSNLRAHLKSAHRNVWSGPIDEDDRKPTIAGTKRIDSFGVSRSTKTSTGPKAEAITELIMDWLCENSCGLVVRELWTKLSADGTQNCGLAHLQ